MSIKDMRRSDWTRIIKRKYISREITSNSISGRESLIAIQEITAPLTVTSTGKAVKIVEVGYCWLQTALKDSRVWMTVMFDEQGKLLQLYFDITAGNCLDNPDNPCFRDMYLDVVMHDDGEIFILDQDELDEALNTGKITQDEYNQTTEACRNLTDYLAGNKESVIAYCCRSYRELRKALFQNKHQA